MSAAPKLYSKTVTLGLGEAVRRLIHLDRRYSAGLLQGDAALERDLLAEALNQYPVNVTMDCNSDTVDVGIGLFEEAAETSCCRVRDYKSDRTPSARPKEAGVKKLARSVRS